jgi:hypothetical protein
VSSHRANNPQSWFRAAAAPGHACRGLVALTRFATVGLGLWLVGVACGGNSDCTLVGWYEGLTVEVQSPDGFADGTHELAIEADGVAVVLAVEFDGGDSTCIPGQEATTCASQVPIDRDRRLFASIESSREPPSLLVNLYYMDRDSLAGGPEVARLRISRGGDTLGDATFEPDYGRDEPNGEGCGVATRAQATLTLSPADGQGF